MDTPISSPPPTHAGGVVLRGDAADPEILVVRPSAWRAGSPRDEWVLPKGHIEAGETVVEAAIREVAEESGAVVTVAGSLGIVEYVAKRKAVVCAFFAMNLVRLEDPEEERDRAWLSLAALEERMPFPITLEVVRRAIARSPG